MNQLIKKNLLSLIFLLSGFMYAQQTIQGLVKDETGVPLPGTTIVVEETNDGTTTDFDGNFSINASNGQTLRISYIGYQTLSIIVGADANYNVSLQPDNELEEVVVTALGIERNAKAVGYSVTQVGGEEVNQIKSTNAITALQGKIAGVQISGNATGAKGSTRIIIRGNSSLAGNNMPLYVIDGIPIDNTNLGSAGVWGGADAGDGISALNPDEVQSVSVLKGAAAAALYGSRASNGVILITTKKGTGAEGIQVELTSSLQFDDIKNDPYDPQTRYGQGRDFSKSSDNADTYANWGPALDGSSVEQWDGVSRPYSYKGNNLNKFYNTGETYINTVAISSSNQSGNVRMSYSNLQNKDILPNSSLTRHSLGLNATQKIRNITVDVNLKHITDDAIGAPRLSDSPGNANFGIRLFAPSIDVNDMLGEGGLGTNKDGSEFRTSDNPYSQNPWFAAHQYFDNSTKDRFIGSSSVRWDINDFLYVKYRFGMDRYDYDRTSGTPYGTAYQPLGSMSEQKLTRQQTDTDLFIGTDNLKLTDDLSVTAFIGANRNNLKFEEVSASGSNFIVPFLYNIKNTENQGNNFNFSEREISSAYGSAEIGFKDALFLSVTARNDWFSTLSLAGKTSPNNDLYTSASLSAVLSDLFNLPEEISFAKLRAGYSQVAGGAGNPYRLNLTYSIVDQGHQGAALGRISNNSIPNSEITPFEKNETEVGLDLRLFDNKYSLDFTYYDNKTDGDIVGVSASSTSGYNSALANLGVITNEGIELLLNANLIRTEDLNLDLTFNYSNNESTIVSTNDAGTNITLDEPRSRNLNVTHIVGEQFGALYGTSYVRDSQGRIVHEIGDDGVPLPKVGPRKILGFGVSPVSVGFGANTRYKDFSLSFLIEGKSGGQIFSGTNALAKYFGAHKATIDSDGRENGFTVSGVDADGNTFNKVIAPDRIEDYWRRTYQIAEESVYDNDYLRLRQISLGYNVPNEILETTFISSARVSLIGRNLFLISNSVENIDPESGYNVSNSQGLEWFGLPVPRSVGLNINLKF